MADDLDDKNPVDPRRCRNTPQGERLPQVPQEDVGAVTGRGDEVAVLADIDGVEFSFQGKMRQLPACGDLEDREAGNGPDSRKTTIWRER